jgi:hypothetical protein
MTDWTVDREYIPSFDRVSKIIDFKGCGTADEIHECIRQKQRANDFRATLKQLRPRFSKKSAQYENEQLQKLIDNDFGVYTIAYANRHPDGIVNLTLRYGREKAEQLLLARAINRRGTLRPRRLNGGRW